MLSKTFFLDSMTNDLYVNKGGQLLKLVHQCLERCFLVHRGDSWLNDCLPYLYVEDDDYNNVIEY